MTIVKSELTASFFKTYLSYNETTGKFFWLDRPHSMFSDWRQANKWNGRYAGREAGSKSTPRHGYRKMQITLCRMTFSLHRIAALYLGLIKDYGEKLEIDHFDGDPFNNRHENLRACTRSINARNAKRRVTNTSGITGVRFEKILGKFQASAKINYKPLNLGYFETIFEAACARRSWELVNQYTKRHI